MVQVTLAIFVVYAGFASDLWGKTCQLQITGNDSMQYDKKKLTVDTSCQKVTLTLIHGGQLPMAAMGHNWVLTKTADKAAVVAAGVTAGAQKGYLKKDDPRIIAATDMLGGKGKTSITFATSKLKTSGKYTFFCTFPGHAALMSGDFLFVTASSTKTKDKSP